MVEGTAKTSLGIICCLPILAVVLAAVTTASVVVTAAEVTVGRGEHSHGRGRSSPAQMGPGAVGASQHSRLDAGAYRAHTRAQGGTAAWSQ